jgi:fatty-acyl-CoA synthase
MLHAPRTLGDYWAGALSRNLDRPAVCDGAVELSYRALRDATARTMAALHALGLRRGDGIAFLSSNRVEVAAVSIAAAMMGLRSTSLHPAGSEEDHRFVVADAEVRALVVDDRVYAGRGMAVAAACGVMLLTLGPAGEGIDIVAAAAAAAPAPFRSHCQPGDIAAIGYTGGTTGRPKGAVHPQRSLVACMLASLAEWQWPEEIRYLAATPISHVAGQLILPTLLRGGSVHLLPSFDPDAYLATIARARITTAFAVPTMLYRLLETPALAHTDVRSLATFIYGAAPMSPARMGEALERFGPVFMQLYAQTEAPNTICALRKEDHDPARPDRLGSCGQPLGSVTVRLLDGELNEVAAGEPGEICVRGPIVMDGYWQRPEETAAALRGDWLHTGDIARADADGFITIVDRAKDMIITGGFNVYPREVEDALDAHPSVARSAVIGVPDADWGERVVAFVIGRAPVHADQLIDHVRTRKGAVCAPKEVRLVETLPLTAVGKVDKKALRGPEWAQMERMVS